TLEIYHDGSNGSPVTLALQAEGVWDVVVPSDAASLSFEEVSVGAPALTQDVFIPISGTHGRVRITGFTVEGSTDFSVAQIGLAAESRWGTGARIKAYAFE